MLEHSDEAQAEVHKSLIEVRQFESIEEAESFNDGRIWSGILKKGPVIRRFYSRAGELGVLSIRQAGKDLGLNVELDAEYMVGKSWADTH